MRKIISTTINEPILRGLAEANSALSTRVLGQLGGYSIVVRYGEVERTLATARGEIRLFKLDNASKFLSELGISKFEVETFGFQPGRIRKARPDRAAALKKTRTKPLQTKLDLVDK